MADLAALYRSERVSLPVEFMCEAPESERVAHGTFAAAFTGPGECSRIQLLPSLKMLTESIIPSGLAFTCRRCGLDTGERFDFVSVRSGIRSRDLFRPGVPRLTSWNAEQQTANITEEGRGKVRPASARVLLFPPLLDTGERFDFVSVRSGIRSRDLFRPGVPRPQQQ
jgi:hypothetical protein